MKNIQVFSYLFIHLIHLKCRPIYYIDLKKAVSLLSSDVATLENVLEEMQMQAGSVKDTETNAPASDEMPISRYFTIIIRGFIDNRY